MSTTKLYTVEDLMAIADSGRYELIDGELVEVPPSSSWASVLAGRIFKALILFVDMHDLGYVTVADGGYTLGIGPDTVLAPDAGVLLRHHFPEGLPHTGYAQMRPDIAVEVISPSDERGDMRRKQGIYERAGVPIVWWVDPKRKVVVVHSQGEEPTIKREGDELNGGDVLHGFRLSVDAIFRD